jgi:hypothetical protein
MKFFCYVEGYIRTLDSLQRLYDIYVAHWVYNIDPRLSNALSVVPMRRRSQRRPLPHGDFWTRELVLLLSSRLSGANSILLFVIC